MQSMRKRNAHLLMSVRSMCTCETFNTASESCVCVCVCLLEVHRWCSLEDRVKIDIARGGWRSWDRGWRWGGKSLLLEMCFLVQFQMHQLSKTGWTRMIRTKIRFVTRMKTKMCLQVRCRRESFWTVGTRMRTFAWEGTEKLKMVFLFREHWFTWMHECMFLKMRELSEWFRTLSTHERSFVGMSAEMYFQIRQLTEGLVTLHTFIDDLAILFA